MENIPPSAVPGAKSPVKRYHLLCNRHYAGINLTCYHPPRTDSRAANFFPSKSLPPEKLFSAKLRSPGRKNETKIPTPGHNLPSSNAKISMKKEHYSKKTVSFQIFHNCPFDNFFYRENKVFANLYTTVKINTV